MYNGKIIEDYKSFGTTRLALMQAMGWNNSSQLRQFITGNPTAENLEKVADYLGITIDSLFLRNNPLENVNRTNADYIVIGSTSTPDGKDYKDLDALHELLFERGVYTSPWHYIVPIDGASYSGDLGVDFVDLDCNILPSPSIIRHTDRNYLIFRVAYVGGKRADGKKKKDTRTDQQKKHLEKVVGILKGFSPLAKIVTESDFQKILMGGEDSNDILSKAIV